MTSQSYAEVDNILSRFPSEIRLLSVFWSLMALGTRVSPLPVQQILQLGKKGLLVLEVSINTGKAHIRNLVQRPQLLHQQFANLRGW